ncbi:hypothetical protein GOP47_0007055 [Adiantum capillus-veneris]|uniref:Uncharacterized protein n=1 Tax=Adiantum capillus-veneris TaxID=13818 RepID=A0A9D4ZL56_ADICA|nr:hypothetical protein GOP47_0007055 [Adiantum capillus-veneris]
MWNSSHQQYQLELPCSSARFSYSNFIHACRAVTWLEVPFQRGFSFAQRIFPLGSRISLHQSNSIWLCKFSSPGHTQKGATKDGVFMMRRGYKQVVFSVGGELCGMNGTSRPREEFGTSRVDIITDDPSSRSTLIMNTVKDVAIKRDYATAAQSGLANALCKAGLSEKDSVLVASKAPITVRFLISAAHELDEFATWTAQQPSTQQDLDQKICELATANPSRQFAALVESIGVEERKISRVCHFLISQNIADVLQKIRLLEDVFPNEKDDGIAIRTRRMMRGMSLSADGALQKSLSFFEKMEAKRGGTDILNIPREAMPLVIEEFPEILVRDLESDFRTLKSYFEEIGVPRERVTSVVMCFPSILLYRSVEELQSRLRTLKKDASVRPRNFGRMVVKYPWILSRCVESNVKLLTNFLITVKVPPEKIGRCITKCPNLLGSSTMPMQMMAQHLTSMGIKRVTLGRILTHYPQLLLQKPRSFDEIVTFLKSWRLDESDILKLLVRCPPIFASTVAHLQMKITFLQQLGIRNQRLLYVLRRYPEYLMLSLENSLKPRIRFLKSIGLSNQDIAFMVCGFPPLLGYSIDHVLKPKLDVLENVLCHPIKGVVAYPRYFSYCLKKKILPRFRIMKRANVEWDLKSMLSPSDDQFAHDYLGFGRMLVPPIRLKQS